MEKYEEIEKSIRTTYKKRIWAQFIKGIKEFEMIKDGDKIAVCISGGKDSMLLAKCMQELKKHRKMDFELVFLVMNPGYSEENKKKIIDNSKILNIPITMFETSIFESIERIDDHPCYVCARMRRGYLYKQARALGCNKIALGHHFDDVVETILLNQIFNGTFSTMMPKLKSDNFENIELIRPLYLIRENDIIAWKNYNELEFLDCACNVTKKSSGKRIVVKNLIKELNKIYKDADKNIFSSTSNVNLDALIGYKKNNQKINFLDEYQKNLKIDE